MQKRLSLYDVLIPLKIFSEYFEKSSRTFSIFFSSAVIPSSLSRELGLSLKQMKNWSYRHNCEKRNTLKGIMPKRKGRPIKDGQPPKQEVEKELERLRMENKLLRDFLQSTERT